MRYRVTLSAEVDRNSDEIYLWLAKHSPDGAGRWFSAMLEAVRSLEENPERNPLAPEDAHLKKGIRQLLFKTRQGNRYRLLYVVADDTVYVLYVRGPGQAPIAE